MKKTLILILGLMVPFFVTATEQEKTWSDLEQSCFREHSQVQNPGKGTLKIRLMQPDQLFFVQNQELLSRKILKNGQQQYIDYTILALNGVTTEERKKQGFLYDGNYQTSLAFDPYSYESPQLTLDAGRQLAAGEFSLRLHSQGKTTIRYFISKNNKDYIEVDNPAIHHWQYLKIRFDQPEKAKSKRYPVSIQELNILKQAPATFLVNSRNNQPIQLFSGFDCIDQDYTMLYNQTVNQSRKTRFSINAGTKLVDLTLSSNPEYNPDFDNDGIPNSKDNCRFKANPDQKDTDQDLVGDLCDFDNETRNFYDRDSDHDGIGDSVDNCVYLFNPKQQDSNADNRGDLCSDDDHDGLAGHLDNCVHLSNPDQKDININGIGDACEFDKDNDGIFDSVDNCITTKNANQADQDNDGIGDICDNCSLYNPSQLDANRNGQGDRCEEESRYLQSNDKDGDGIIDAKDNCETVANHNQRDTDRDGIGDACDNCANLQNTPQLDIDKNGVGDMCEDSDHDGIIGHLDNCISLANKDQADADNDGVGDVCEDDDGDGFVAADDNCPYLYNKDQWDNDRDGIGDACDDKDDRLIESNRGLVIGMIVFITTVFGILIFSLIKKLKNSEFNHSKTDMKDE